MTTRYSRMNGGSTINHFQNARCANVLATENWITSRKSISTIRMSMIFSKFMKNPEEFIVMNALYNSAKSMD